MVLWAIPEFGSYSYVKVWCNGKRSSRSCTSVSKLDVESSKVQWALDKETNPMKDFTHNFNV